MKINTKALNELIEEKYRGNKTWFAEIIGLNPKTLIQLLNGSYSDESPKAIRCITMFCKNNKLNYKDYIFLP